MAFLSLYWSLGVVVAACALCGALALGVLSPWNFRRLKWRHVTPRNCWRYLVLRGWRYIGTDGRWIELNKGDLRITITCLGLDVVTANAVRASLDGAFADQRHRVVIVAGTVEPGVAEQFFSSRITVLPYQQLNRLETILRAHHKEMESTRSYEALVRSRAPAPPTPAALLTPAPAAAATVGISAETPIAETAHVQCFLRDRGGDTLVIAFNDSWRSGLSGRLQPGLKLEKRDISILDFVTRAPNWFPGADMAALIPAVRALLGDRFARRVTFGFSQGGYGAIKFSRALGATSTVAIAPQFSIDPRVVKGGRFAAQFSNDLNVGMAIEAADCACPVYLFHDPYDNEDGTQAALIAAEVAVAMVPVRYGGHFIQAMFAAPDAFLRIIEAGEAGDVTALARQARAFSRGNRNRAFKMAERLVETRPWLALRLATAHRAAWPVNGQSQLYFRLAVRGYPAIALQWTEALAAEYPDDDKVQGRAAQVALLARQMDQAARYAERAMALNPQNQKWSDLQAAVASARSRAKKAVLF